MWEFALQVSETLTVSLWPKVADKESKNGPSQIIDTIKIRIWWHNKPKGERGFMVLKEVLDLLDMKNSALEEFISENDRFMTLAKEETTSLFDFQKFYKIREHILLKINKIDSMIEKVCGFHGYEFIDIEETREHIICRQNKKKILVTRIIDQDLSIMSMYADRKISATK